MAFETTVTMSMSEYENMKATIAKLKESKIERFVSHEYANDEAFNKNEFTLKLNKKEVESYFDHPVEVD